MTARKQLGTEHPKGRGVSFGRLPAGRRVRGERRRGLHWSVSLEGRESWLILTLFCATPPPTPVLVSLVDWLSVFCTIPPLVPSSPLFLEGVEVRGSEVSFKFALFAMKNNLGKRHRTLRWCTSLRRHRSEAEEPGFEPGEAAPGDRAPFREAPLPHWLSRS